MIRAELAERAKLSFVAGMRVEPVGLGEGAGLVGAAALARTVLV